MSIQKVIFLFCSPPGEAVLNTMLQEHTASMPPKDRMQVLESFTRAIHKSPDGHSIRVWFQVAYDDTAPQIAFLKRFLAHVSVDDIFFARFGEASNDFEEIGNYKRVRLPEED